MVVSGALTGEHALARVLLCGLH
ncbi:MAG: hypothetical protein QOE67_307, partial [Solirubrobacteraceae bacterium]|nr:hypothetical protein [Solirubrobacteraceae bacterium]